MTIPRYIALRAEWRRRPPAHWLLAAALQYGERDKKPQPLQPTVAELKAALFQ